MSSSRETITVTCSQGHAWQSRASASSVLTCKTCGERRRLRDFLRSAAAPAADLPAMQPAPAPPATAKPQVRALDVAPRTPARPGSALARPQRRATVRMSPEREPEPGWNPPADDAHAARMRMLNRTLAMSRQAGGVIRGGTLPGRALLTDEFNGTESIVGSVALRVNDALARRRSRRKDISSSCAWCGSSPESANTSGLFRVSGGSLGERQYLLCARHAVQEVPAGARLEAV